MTSDKDLRSLPDRRRYGTEDRAVDMWLQRELALRFGATLEEALPLEMLAILSKLH